MSLKITNSTGFVIGGVTNPSITTIYVRVLADMNNQELDNDTVKIRCNAKVTLSGGLFDSSIQVDYIYSTYWLEYSALISDMNEQYLAIEEDLKAKLIERNPEWTGKVQIVTLGVNQDT